MKKKNIQFLKNENKQLKQIVEKIVEENERLNHKLMLNSCSLDKAFNIALNQEIEIGEQKIIIDNYEKKLGIVK